MSTKSTTTERPILFSAPMVRAIFNGSKSQTRRVVKPQPAWVASPSVPFKTADADPRGTIRCPYGKPGDRLWVRETWCPRSGGTLAMDRACKPRYRADEELRLEWGFRWRPSIHMPRWASRITLEVVNVRVERVQDIGDEDAIAEGVAGSCECWSCCGGDHAGKCRECAGWGEVDGKTCGHCGGDQLCPTCEEGCSCANLFQKLWDSINGKTYPWASNPWVWVVEFKRIESKVVQP